MKGCATGIFGMLPGLRYSGFEIRLELGTNRFFRGPLVFCLVLSLFLSVAKGDQASLVFSGVFCIVWIGEAAVTLQIKLLGGKM